MHFINLFYIFLAYPTPNFIAMKNYCGLVVVGPQQLRKMCIFFLVNLSNPIPIPSMVEDLDNDPDSSLLTQSSC